MYLNNLKFKRQKAVPLIYKNVRLGCGYRIDLMAGDKIIVEIKTIDKINEVHLAQVWAYLQLTRSSLGFILNFNGKQLIKGIKRVIL